MVYVDENLCTGCGICIDACNQGAISLQGNAAVIDEARCTSCGTCIDVCMTGAIISVEPVESTPEPSTVRSETPVETGKPQQLWVQTSSPYAPVAPQAPAAPSQPAAAKTSRLELVEKALSGIFSLATYALDRKRSSAIDRADMGAVAGSGSAQWPGRQAGRTGRSPGGGRGPGGGGGRGPGAGRGRGSGRGPGGGRRGNRKNATR